MEGGSERIGPEDVEVWSTWLFDTEPKAEQWYIEYGLSMGFEVSVHYRNLSGRVADKSGKIFYIKYRCSRAGFSKKSKRKVEIGPAVMDVDPQVQGTRNHGEVKIGCKACVRLKLNERLDKYYITHWVDNHNHVTVEDDKSQHLMRRRRNVTEVVGVMASINNECGIPLRSSYEILCGHLGGEGNVGCTKVDVKNFLGKARQRKMLYGEETSINEIQQYHLEQVPEHSTEGEPVYLVYKHDGNARLDDRLVRARPQEGEVLCECKWWGTMGILCRHALTVMHILGRFGNSKFNTLPDIYISKRTSAKLSTRGCRRQGGRNRRGGGGGIASKFPKKPKPSKNSKRQKAIAEISRMRQRAKYRNLRAKEAAEASGREHDLAQIFNNDAINAFTAFVQSQESNNISKTTI
ncbi:Protein FAR1-RELATED SEQUENCE 5 [Linum grandiflorum]